MFRIHPAARNDGYIRQMLEHTCHSRRHTAYGEGGSAGVSTQLCARLYWFWFSACYLLLVLGQHQYDTEFLLLRHATLQHSFG